MTFYARGRKEKNFEAGVTKALEAILASPQFLFRVEETPRLRSASSGEAGSRRRAYRLGDYELASRLSFFLWGSGPDAELLKAAGQGRLALPGALSKQAQADAGGAAVPMRSPRGSRRSGCGCRISRRSFRIRSCIRIPIRRCRSR